MNLNVSQEANNRRIEGAKELLARRKSRANMLDFTLYTMPEYRPNWHQKLLCEYLDAFVAKEIKRLIVALPPRHSKSELVSRRLPAFIFGKNPNAQIIATSYGASLSQRFNRDVQRIIDSNEYKRLFPDTQLNTQNARATNSNQYLRNSDIFEIVGYKGSYRGTGVGGGITGMGFDYGIIDDPIQDARAAMSATIRESIWEWYATTFYTRQQNNASILITMTRWHSDDLVGRLLDQMKQGSSEHWEVLELPAILDSEMGRHPNDPRQVGEALWESDYGLDFLNKSKEQNAFAFSAMYQQRPVPIGSGVFNTSKITIIDYVPDTVRQVRFYDLAVTAKKHSDYTAGVLMGILEDETIIILDVYRVQKPLPDVEFDIVRNAHSDGTRTSIVLEAEKAGIIQMDYLLRNPELRGYAIRKVPPIGDKYTRAQPFASRVNEGRVMLLRGSWNLELLNEMDTFPMGAHDDQVDALSGAYDQLKIDYTQFRVLQG